MMKLIKKETAMANIEAMYDLASANHNYLEGMQDAAEAVEQTEEIDAIPREYIREKAYAAAGPERTYLLKLIGE